MAVVVFSSGLARHTGGEERVEIDARRVDQLIELLCERYPALRGHIEQMAVAIDDQVHNQALYVPLNSDSEVHFLPRIGGGRD
ncbi:MoaD/ThiS family protein [Myxococcota bacterium]|nr:MoaD/ThiS family protein [Myxococcota bacterium]